jgi:hypothetical protein
MILFAIAGPFGIQVNAGDHQYAVIFRRKYNPEMVPVGNAFQRVGLAPVIRFYLFVIDLAFFQYLLYFPFINMPAFHATTGVLAVKDMAGMTVDPLIPVGVIAGWQNGRNGDPVVCLFRSGFCSSFTVLVRLDEPEQAGGADQRNKWKIFFKHAAI